MGAAYAVGVARMARVVVLGFPHHVTERGVRSIDVFFCDGDRAAYLGLMPEPGRAAEPEASDRLRRHVRGGRPCASRSFVETPERLLGRRLRLRPAGRPSKRRRQVLRPRNTPGSSHNRRGPRAGASSGRTPE